MEIRFYKQSKVLHNTKFDFKHLKTGKNADKIYLCF